MNLLGTGRYCAAVLVFFVIPLFPSSVSAVVTEIMDFDGDGANTLEGPWEVAVDFGDNVLVAGATSDNAFMIARPDECSTSGPQHCWITKLIDSDGDGSAIFDRGWGIATDSDGNIFVTGTGSNNAFKITRSPACATGASPCPINEIVDSSAGGHSLSSPSDIAIDSAGNVFVTGAFSHNGLRITPGSPVAEIIDSSGDRNGNTLSVPEGMVADSSGNVYLWGTKSDNAFKIAAPHGCSTSGPTLCTITEIIDSNGDGPGGNLLDRPSDIAIDANGNVFVAGLESDNVFRITPAGEITEIIDWNGDRLGNGLDAPTGVAVDEAGNVFVVGRDSDNAFMIETPDSCATGGPDPRCKITQIIDSAGDENDNLFAAPEGVAVDGFGNVFVSGTETHNVFKISIPKYSELEEAKSCLGSTGSCLLAGVNCVLAFTPAAPVSIPAGVISQMVVAACNYAVNPNDRTGLEASVTWLELAAHLSDAIPIPCSGGLSIITSCGEQLAEAYSSLCENTFVRCLFTTGIVPFVDIFGVSVHSPVSIEIVDGDGNNMTIDEQGNVSSLISGGWIFMLDQGDQFAQITNPSSIFTVRVHGDSDAAAGSTFSLGLLLPPVGAGTYHSIEFIDVPTRDGAIAEVVVDVDEETTDYQLAIDLDGDGSYEGRRCPATIDGQPATSCDADEDGVVDVEDACFDTLPGALIDAQGCSIQQLVPCNGPLSGGVWRNHGHYVVAVIHEVRDFVAAGWISPREGVAIIIQAVRSKCGRK